MTVLSNLDRSFRRLGGIFLSVLVCWTGATAQQPSSTPLPDETVRVPTEEVHLTLHAEGPYAGLRPKLRTDDFTIFEDGVPQTVTSMRDVPARAMILVDSGAALTFAKTRQVTTLVAQIVVNNLPEGSFCSVAQYSDRVETIVPWTSDRNRAVVDLEGRVKTGRRSLLRTALEHARQSFLSQPIENRHLILITDGLDGANAVDPEAPEFIGLAAANVVVHVLSYTRLEQGGAKAAGKTVRINLDPRRSKPRVPKEIFNDMIRSLPIKIEAKEFLKTMNEAQQIIIVDLDGERKKMLRTRREEWTKGETRLQELAVETGGNVRTPSVPADLFTDAAEIARGIGSHYDVTYMPSRTLVESGGKTKRTVSVTSRSDVVKLRTRKTLTAP